MLNKENSSLENLDLEQNASLNLEQNPMQDEVDESLINEPSIDQKIVNEALNDLSDEESQEKTSVRRLSLFDTLEEDKSKLETAPLETQQYSLEYIRDLLMHR